MMPAWTCICIRILKWAVAVAVGRCKIEPCRNLQVPTAIVGWLAADITLHAARFPKGMPQSSMIAVAMPLKPSFHMRVWGKGHEVRMTECG
jgi:hypothetical protein